MADFKSDPKKATLHKEGAALASYIYVHYPALKKRIIQFPEGKSISVAMNSYIKAQEKQLRQNRVVNIVGVTDATPRTGSTRYSTGGRVHLFVGVIGPTGRAIATRISGMAFKNYKAKSIAFLEAIELASGIKPPWAGNIHCHPFYVGMRKVDHQTIRDYIRKEHGDESETPVTFGFTYWELATPARRPQWIESNAEGIRLLFA